MSAFEVAIVLMGTFAFLSIPAQRRNPRWGYVTSLVVVAAMAFLGSMYFFEPLARPIVGIAILAVAVATLMASTMRWIAAEF